MTSHPNTCIACGADDVQPVLSIERAPVLCNELSHSRAEALDAQVAPIELAHCATCGHFFNATFDAGRIVYGPDYENSLHFSPRFRDYSASLVDSLSRRHELGGSSVVEVGCGNGDFLRQLCAPTGASGYGFDPGYDGPELVDDRVHLSASSFFEATPVSELGLLCCRHVLEHVEDPRKFVAGIAAKLRADSGTALYMEVPNALYTLRDLGIWDIIYEHPSYFCVESLRSVVHAAGFGEIEVEETFGGQFLSLHAKLERSSPKASAANSLPADMAKLVDQFADAYRAKIEQWKATLLEAKQAGRKVAVWGAGSKGASFLNIVDPNSTVAFVIDVNPAKHGKFVAGTGHKIVAPEALRESPVETIILMNPLYEGEVRATLDSVNPAAALLLA